jgi:hypothetical protein
MRNKNDDITRLFLWTIDWRWNALVMGYVHRCGLAPLRRVVDRQATPRGSGLAPRRERGLPYAARRVLGCLQRICYSVRDSTGTTGMLICRSDEPCPSAPSRSAGGPRPLRTTSGRAAGAPRGVPAIIFISHRWCPPPPRPPRPPRAAFSARVACGVARVARGVGKPQRCRRRSARGRGPWRAARSSGRASL